MEAIQSRTRFQAMLFPVLDVLLNGGNLLIHVFISWYMTIGNYGILNAFISLLFVLMIGGMSMQTYFAKRISDRNFEQEEIERLSHFTNRMIILVLLAMWLISYPMIELLRGTLIQYGLMLSIFAVQARLSYYRGYIQGMKAFLKLNISFYVEMLFKVAALVPLLINFKSVEVVLLSIMIGMVASLVVTKRDAGKLEPQTRTTASVGTVLEKTQTNKISSMSSIKGFAKVFSTQFFFYYFTAVVLIITNYYMGDLSGLYAVSTRYAQIFVHIGLSVVTVLIPYISEVKHDTTILKRKVSTLLILYMVIGAILFLGYAMIMPQVLTLLFESSYQGAHVLIIPQAFAYLMLAIAFYMASMEMVAESRSYLIILMVFAIIIPLALIAWHGSLIQVVTVEMTMYTLMAITLMIHFKLRRETK